MDENNSTPPVAREPSKVLSSVMARIFIFVVALVFAYDTSTVISSGNAYDFVQNILVLPIVLIVSWILYSRGLYLVYKKYPKVLYVLLVIFLVNASYSYYYNFRKEQIYPARLVIRDNLQVGDVGEATNFGIVPENSNDTYSNNIDVPITLHLPDKTKLQSVATIFPYSTNCRKIFLRLKCTAESRDFPLVDRFFVLSQPGQYFLDSSDPNIKGIFFDVAVKSASSTPDILPLPGTISTYKKDPNALVINQSDRVKIREMYLEPNPSGGNLLILVNINRYNLSNNLTDTDLSNYLKNYLNLGWAYDIDDISIGNQKVRTAWVNVYGQKSSDFPDELGTPVVSWISSNKIISVDFDKYKNNKLFNFTDSYAADFVEAILHVYPSTMR